MRTVWALKLDNPFILIDIIPLFYIRLLKYVTNCLICLNSSIAAFERTGRCKNTCQVDFSSRLEMTCNETDDARKFRRRRCFRPTWLDLEGPGRLESTWSTRLAGLFVQANWKCIKINFGRLTCNSKLLSQFWTPVFERCWIWLEKSWLPPLSYHSARSVISKYIPET